MGNFRIVIDAVGGHGCQREKKDGEPVFGCRRLDCPDCLTQEFVERLSKIGTVNKAEFIHWPGEANSVTDEFVLPTHQIKKYEKSRWDDEAQTVIKTGEIDHYIEFKPIHRIRHGNF